MELPTRGGKMFYHGLPGAAWSQPHGGAAADGVNERELESECDLLVCLRQKIF
jgi:hypothetical protein